MTARSSRRARGLQAALVSLLLTTATGAAAKPALIFTDSLDDAVVRVRPDGTGVQPLVTSGLTTPVDVAIDETAGRIYISDRSDQRIYRANADGSAIETILSGFRPQGIAIDSVDGKIYFTDRTANSVRRANLDGSAAETLVAGLGDPWGIALDLVADKIYWTDPENDTIQRADLDGSNVENVLALAPGNPVPNGIAVDPAEGRIYWSDLTSPFTISRADLDGTDSAVLVSGERGNDIALDPAGGFLYWANAQTGRLMRATLAGGDVTPILENLRAPLGIDFGDDGLAASARAVPAVPPFAIGLAAIVFTALAGRRLGGKRA